MYRKEFFVFDQDKPVPVVIRNYEKKDFPNLIRIQQESFPPPFPTELWWNEEQLNNPCDSFSTGSFMYRSGW